MPKNIEGFSEEKVYVNTYESLVRELASGMRVDGEKILPKEGDKFDHEDIASWIGAVRFDEGKKPDIVANLSVEKGSKVVSFDTGKLRALTSEDQTLSKEEALYSMALTEAKMKVIRDIAEETYPAVAFQIGDYQKEMEKVRKEIFNVRDASVVMKEFFRELNSKKTLKLATILVISAMILAACNTPQRTETPGTNTQPVATEVSPMITSTEPGAVVTPIVETATPIEVETNPEYIEIDQRVRQFLNSEGSFTDEALEKLPHMGFDYVGIGGSNEMLKGNYLGIMEIFTFDNGTELIDSSNWQDLELSEIRFQAIFLGGVYKDDQVVMFMGMVDKDGRRVVAPVGRTVNPEYDSEYYLGIMQYDGGSRNIEHTGTSYTGISLDNFDRLSDMAGYALVFTCVPKPIEGPIRDQMVNNPPTGVEMLEKTTESIPQCRALYNSVASVRDSGLGPMEDADENYLLYDINSFDGVQAYLKSNTPEPHYGNIFFVRQ